MVFNPLFCLSRWKSILILYSDPVIKTMETAFPCSGILYLCFKSLGLDITSVLLNPFKMAATYPFCDFFLSKNHMNDWFPRDTLWIQRVLSIPTNLLLELKTCSNRILSISISKIYLRSCSNLLIGINPRSLPLRNESILSTRAPSCTIYITTQQKRGVVVEENKRCRAKSTFIPI